MFSSISSELMLTIILLVVLMVVRLIVSRTVSKVLKRFEFTLQRKRVALKVVNLVLLLTAATALTGIWGLKGSDLFVFLSTVITVLGIAFFAQWSILSNITSGLILFFNHPLKIGDTIEIYDKEFPIKGRVDDISFFFLYIRTPEGERYSVPNNILLQKSIRYFTGQEPEANRIRG